MNRGSSRDFGKKPMSAPSTPGGTSKVVPIASLNPYQSKLVWMPLFWSPFLLSGICVCATSLCGAIYELRYMFPRWTIRARVTNKSAIRTWSNSRGDGKLFSMDIVDESVRILTSWIGSAVQSCECVNPWLFIDCGVYREKLEWLGLIRKWTNSTPWSNRGRQVVVFKLVLFLNLVWECQLNVCGSWHIGRCNYSS